MADNGGPVSESGGDVVGEVGVDGGEDGDVVGDFADAAEEVDGGFEATEE